MPIVTAEQGDPDARVASAAAKIVAVIEEHSLTLSQVVNLLASLASDYAKRQDPSLQESWAPAIGDLVCRRDSDSASIASVGMITDTRPGPLPWIVTWPDGSMVAHSTSEIVRTAL
jgi:hypothetical protein